MKDETPAIQEGSLASLQVLRILAPSTTEEGKEKKRKDLLAYCKHGTRGMVKIQEELLKRFPGHLIRYSPSTPFLS